MQNSSQNYSTGNLIQDTSNEFKDRVKVLREKLKNLHVNNANVNANVKLDEKKIFNTISDLNKQINISLREAKVISNNDEEIVAYIKEKSSLLNKYKELRDEIIKKYNDLLRIKLHKVTKITNEKFKKLTNLKADFQNKLLDLELNELNRRNSTIKGERHLKNRKNSFIDFVNVSRRYMSIEDEIIEILKISDLAITRNKIHLFLENIKDKENSFSNTLIKILIGEWRSTDGCISIDGINIESLSRKEIKFFQLANVIYENLEGLEENMNDFINMLSAKIKKQVPQLIIIDRINSNISDQDQQKFFNYLTRVKETYPKITFLVFSKSLSDSKYVEKTYFIENGSIKKQSQ